MPAIALPPNGWYVHGEQGTPLLAYSAIIDGHRADYVDSRAYIYANGRGELTRLPKATTNRQLVALLRNDDTIELFGLGENPIIGVSLNGRAATAVALDAEGNSLGQTTTRLSRAVVYVSPVPAAVSYLLTPIAAPGVPLTCDRTAVIPGETITIGPAGNTVSIPKDAQIGSQYWYEADGQWIDFTIVPLVTPTLTKTDDGDLLTLTSQVPHAATALVQLGGQRREVQLPAGEVVQLAFEMAAPGDEQVQELPLTVTVGDLIYQRSWWAKTAFSTKPLGGVSEPMQTGKRLRGQPEMSLDGRALAVAQWTERACGNESRKCLFMHPPYSGGVGYTFALFEPIALPRGTSGSIPVCRWQGRWQ